MLIFGTSLNKTFFENLSLKVSLPFVNTSGTKLTVILNMLYSLSVFSVMISEYLNDIYFFILRDIILSLSLLTAITYPSLSNILKTCKY